MTGRAGRPDDRRTLSAGRHPRLYVALLGMFGLSAAVAINAPSAARACAPVSPAPVSAGAATDQSTGPAAECDAGQQTPRAGGGRGARKPLARISADPGQPVVAATPSTLTAATITMTGLRFDGVVDLPTNGGTVTALKLTMDRVVTDDVLLRSSMPTDRTMPLTTDRLTIQGDVALYATRIVGQLLGIEIELTPHQPLPDGISTKVPNPITVTEPAIDLAFVTGNMLTARQRLKARR
ncbi:hypothetical protein [Micromonospora sp. WMMD812]|uniref:hypothetical protein n=1 Tax=Micromonospora sp. WMMD812 TaxID=3015152 RepID=UPI00248ABAFE|nr:hypothetical protein [Micromonospora sp. WMMD812]WBB68047.1 hypothetical protein O7603_01305 [Micromonospora sp. WMMD812]